MSPKFPGTVPRIFKAAESCPYPRAGGACCFSVPGNHLQNGEPIGHTRRPRRCNSGVMMPSILPASWPEYPM